GLDSVILAFLFFVGIIVFMEVGRRLGSRRAARLGEEAAREMGRAEAAVFALLSLLLGVTFSGSAARYDARRGLVVAQAVALNDVWQYSSMLPDAEGGVVRGKLLGYLDALLATYAVAPGTEEELRRRHVLAGIEAELWGYSVQATRADIGEKA